MTDQVQLAEEALKACTKCLRELPLDQFHRSGAKRHPHCRDCKNAVLKVWRGANPDYMKGKSAARYAAMTPAERAVRLAQVRQNYRDNSWRWRRDRLLKKYGMSMDDYDALVRAQGNRCAICGTAGEESNKGCLHVDHDHETGAVRGLLCGNCNTGLGQFKDDPNRLARAITYLTDPA